MTEYIERYKLPSIEMYGGDTTPWVVTLVNENGTDFHLPENVEYTCTLTLLPYASSTGNSAYATAARTVLKKKAVIAEASDGSCAARINFTSSDTRMLRGKYTYQIEIEYAGNSRIGQGFLTILGNTDR